jgi:hypothetical protein
MAPCAEIKFASYDPFWIITNDPNGINRKL